MWDPVTEKIQRIQVFPESGPLPIYAHLNTTSFEQKTDAFVQHLLSKNLLRTKQCLHPSLIATLSESDLAAQGTTIVSRMGLTDLSDIDVTHQRHEVCAISPTVPQKCLKLFFSIKGDEMDAEGTALWVALGMTSKILKFDIKTTGKPKRETIFVNPDGTRIQSFD
eukprot:TRINITY_DN31037_c0_g1_i1.p1 TRINITY_DN31037_c0_g1~~TRINITY_DN31037_c0_g1_i1.p1  ORF type:complete len:179 (+),score=54.68 TRINITY_DN31037_c0_g1_i1:42-539(+)